MNLIKSVGFTYRFIHKLIDHKKNKRKEKHNNSETKRLLSEKSHSINKRVKNPRFGIRIRA